MPKFKVLERSFIGDRVYEAGDEVEFSGLPGPNLEPLDKAGEVKAEEAKKVDAEAADRLHAAAETGDPDNAKKAKKAA